MSWLYLGYVNKIMSFSYLFLISKAFSEFTKQNYVLCLLTKSYPFLDFLSLLSKNKYIFFVNETRSETQSRLDCI